MTITVLPTYLPAGDINYAYTADINASGGVTPYTFSITVGSLPPGLAIDSTTGVTSGTPTVSGYYNFTVTVTDHDGVPGNREYFIPINNEPPPAPCPLSAVRVRVGGITLAPTDFTVTDRDPVTVVLAVPPPVGVEVTVWVERGVNWYAPGNGTPSNGIPLQQQTTPAAEFLNGDTPSA